VCEGREGRVREACLLVYERCWRRRLKVTPTVDNAILLLLLSLFFLLDLSLVFLCFFSFLVISPS